MGYGISRDDAGKFLPLYIEKSIFKTDPTDTIDQKGIGRLMKICVEDARAVNPKIKLGICGEHGGEPDSVSSATRSASLTCLAHPSESRSPGSQQPRPRSRKPAPELQRDK